MVRHPILVIFCMAAVESSEWCTHENEHVTFGLYTTLYRAYYRLYSGTKYVLSESGATCRVRSRRLR